MLLMENCNYENYEVLSDEKGNVQILLTNIFEDAIPYFSKDGKINFLHPSSCMTVLPDKEVITLNLDSEKIEVPYSVLSIEISYEKDFESKLITLPFIYLNRFNILDTVFGEHVETFNKQIDKLRKKYYHLKENDFAENRLLFEDRYKVNFISDDNFLQFLYKKFKLLRFNFSFSYFEKFNLVRIDKLILSWNKQDITKDISVSLFHEYCQIIKTKFESELSMHSLPLTAEVLEDKPAPAVFDNSKLNEVMKDDFIDTFLKHEERLKADGFILQNNTWINGRGKKQTLKDLANLILLLKEKKYFKIKLENKRLKNNDYKKFFENRYACNLKDQFNEAIKAESKHLETAKTTFVFI